MKTYEEQAADILRKAQTVRKKRAGAGTLIAVAVVAAVIAGVWFTVPSAQKPVLPTQTTNEPTAAPTETPTGSLPQPTAPAVGPDKSAPPTEPAAPALSSEIGYEPRWEEKDAPSRWTAFQRDGREYSVTGTPVDPALAEDPLWDVTLLGYDAYAEQTHEFAATAKKIRNVNPDAAVEVELEDGNTYVYYDPWYEPATLGDFLRDLNLREYIRFGEAYEDLLRADGSWTRRVYADDTVGDSLIRERLLNAETLENQGWNAFSGVQLWSVRVDVPALGIQNLGLWLTADGMLVTNVLGSAKCFYIGTEQAEAFMSLYRENVPYTDETQPPTTAPPLPEGADAPVAVTEAVCGGYIPE